MKHLKLEDLGIFYALSTAIFLLIVGSVFFKEHMGTAEFVGIVLGIASIILLGKFA